MILRNILLEVGDNFDSRFTDGKSGGKISSQGGGKIKCFVAQSTACWGCAAAGEIICSSESG